MTDWIYEETKGLMIVVIELDRNFSRGLGSNQAVQASSAIRLLITDADVLIDRSAIERAIHVINRGKAW
ncbi:MAG: hypothetical protein AAGC72_03955 [Planctomycetota bacterium]